MEHCFVSIVLRVTLYAVYLALPVSPTVVTYVSENDTLNLDCSSVITVIDFIVDHQIWKDPNWNTVSNSSVYYLFEVSRRAAGNYTCVTYFKPNSNGVANVSSSTMVIIYCMFVFNPFLIFGDLFPFASLDPPTIWSTQPTVYGVQGHSVQLNSTFDGLPVPTITWTSPNGSVLVSQSNLTNNSSYITISSLGLEDAGTYTCSGNNSIGMSLAYIQVIVYCKLHIGN